ncbi:hypothetical protein FQN60_013764 [Etheostoma spectabile]|uniref:Uncharacterized protein n=1 Tax=Etheostoma spectabile TaxID=54343 RepID=A0A5J5CJW0_9PERO|nr:hypothetical protein FQN60_013764 [Etheostoma spectabile]
MMIIIAEFFVVILKVLWAFVTAGAKWVVRPKEKSVAGQVCVITGAGSGLGRLFAKEFARRRAILVLWDINSQSNEETAEMVRQIYHEIDTPDTKDGPVGGVEEVPPFQPQVYTYSCDVGKRESVYSTAEKMRREVGNVDILINNAGVVSGHHLLECPDELIERTMVVNCHALFWRTALDCDMAGKEQRKEGSAFPSTGKARGPPSGRVIGQFLSLPSHVTPGDWLMRSPKSADGQNEEQTTKAFLPKMLELNHGHIVTVASSLGLFSTAGVEDYCASKFGAIGFHESLSHELKASEKDGINMTLVCPYLVDTGMFKGCRIRKEIEPFLPPLKPEFCVKQAMRAILTDQPMICTPRIVYMVNFMKSILPFEAIVCMYRFLGADKCMYPFLAQRKEAMNNNEAKNGI